MQITWCCVFYDRLNTLERVQENSQACDLVNLSISHSLRTLCIPEVFESSYLRGFGWMDASITYSECAFLLRRALSRRALPALRPITNRSINPSRVTNTDAKDTSSSNYWLAWQPKWTPRVTHITHVTITFEIDKKCDRIELFFLDWSRNKICTMQALDEVEWNSSRHIKYLSIRIQRKRKRERERING